MLENNHKLNNFLKTITKKIKIPIYWKNEVNTVLLNLYNGYENKATHLFIPKIQCLINNH